MNRHRPINKAVWYLLYFILENLRKKKGSFRGLLFFGKKNVYIDKYVTFDNISDLFLAGGNRLFRHVQVYTSGYMSVKIGKNSTVCGYTTLTAAGGYIEIGNNVTIGEYSTIQGQGGVIIEDNVLFASHVHIISNHHSYENADIPIKCQENVPNKVVIKENSWLGINVTVLSGVTIGKNCVIGAGTVVTRDIPDYSVAVGVPAKVVKKYDFKIRQWEKIGCLHAK